MPPPNILLIQARRAGDAMALHESACVTRRIGQRRVDLRIANALATPLDSTALDDVDALIIGGSGNFSVHHPLSQAWVTPLRGLLERALKERLPAFGICFGHQLLGQHLGAQVVTAEQHAEMGTVSLTLTEHGNHDALFGGLGGVFQAHTGHSDCVTTTPPGVELLASNERLETQAFRVRGTRFYTTQFHPDMTGAEAVARYEAFRAGLDDPQQYGHGSEKFVAGDDDTTHLIGGFIDMVTATHM